LGEVTLAQRKANAAIIADAFANAGDNKQIPLLPSGRIQVHIDGDAPVGLRGLPILAYVTSEVRGQGSSATILDVYPKDLNDGEYGLFTTDASSDAVNIAFKGFTVEGPTTPTTQELSGVKAFELYQDASIETDPSYLRLEDIILLGDFDYGVSTSAASVKHITVIDSHLECATVCLQAFYDGAVATGSSATVRRSTFAANYPGAPRGTVDNAYCFYIHETVDVDMDDVECQASGGSNGYALNCFGTPNSPLPKTWRLENFRVTDGCNQGILLNSQPVDMHIISSKIEAPGAGMSVFGAGTGRLFLTDTDIIGGPNRLTGSLSKVVMSGGIVDSDQQLNDGVAMIQLQGGGDYSFRGVQLAHTYHAQWSISIDSGGSLVVDDCEFLGVSGVVQNAGVICANGVKGKILNSRFDAYSMMLRLDPTANEITLERNHAKRQGKLGDVSSGGGKILGRDNTFDYPFDIYIDYDGTKQGLEGKAGEFTSTVASGATLALDQNYDLFPITGTATINTINYGYEGLFGGTIYLWSKDGFTLGTSGNILPKGGSHAVAVDETVALRKVVSTGKWMEV
jgi:hypothetical protein